MSNVETHKRETQTLLSFIEKPALNWLAKNLPSFFTPDVLTVLGLIGSLLTGLGYFLTLYNNYYLWLASFGLLVNWFGDSLDGTVARFRHIERPKYGFFIDHTLDSVSMILIGIGVGLSPHARFDFVLLALVGYLLMSILVYIKTFVHGVFKISYFGFGPTEVRLFIILVNIIVFYFGSGDFQILGLDLTFIDIAAAFFAIVLFIFFFASLIIEGKQLKLVDEKKLKA
ncbi:MAG: CDP-alcohol phosphatidyltransferase family protein [Ignavibacteria bacterium]|jgi:phosphatidylglycerophosphate synthase|nr:CDP-alcohol phosphatidyltransferase family protein [Ignavibacteria bacterium]MDH7527075.1 CDP-alcohol phosphatidyltransferase family protein [Ignavibacteria bacterium]